MVIEAVHKSELALTKDTPDLALAGEIWDVFCKILEKIYIIVALHC